MLGYPIHSPFCSKRSTVNDRGMCYPSECSRTFRADRAGVAFRMPRPDENYAEERSKACSETLKDPLEEHKGLSALSAMPPGAFLANACSCRQILALAPENDDFKTRPLRGDRMTGCLGRIIGSWVLSKVFNRLRGRRRGRDRDRT